MASARRIFTLDHGGINPGQFQELRASGMEVRRKFEARITSGKLTVQQTVVKEMII
jgi:hypothetical protein